MKWARLLIHAETFWMFSIAGIAVVMVGGVLVAIAIYGVKEGAGEIIGMALTGLLFVARDVINAMRARWRIHDEGEGGR